MTTITFQPYATGISDAVGNPIGSIDPRLSRTNYFDGQLLKASDLTRDQIYLDERLLEMGQVLGSGIVQGLEVDLVRNHLLQVRPGIAVAPSGRVLQLSGKTLEINLQDGAFIAELNDGKHRRFHQGLYAIVLQYSEVIDGVTKAYPADLVSRRQMQVSSYAEGVELALIPLNIGLPKGDSLVARAALAQQIIGHGGSFDLPTDEAIPLGMIAMDHTRPLWIDLGLLRRPLRRPNLPNALQLNLATHYRELFDDILASRIASGRRNDFAASNYFGLLPPFGPIAKGAIDPITGRQHYFPKDFDVSIAPVRRADLPAILEESAQLAPINLQRDADADIMVLVPMSDQAFALRGRQLEKLAQQQNPTLNKLPWFGGLALRLFTRAPIHLIDTDADTWKAIWDEVDQSELLYVRRPPRTAETNVSAVVLARGFELPPINNNLPLDPASLETQLDQALEESVNARAALSQKLEEVTALQSQIVQLEQTLGSDLTLNEARADVQRLTAELASAQAEIEALSVGTGDAALFKTALQAATDKITQLSTELAAAQERIAALQAAGGSTTDTASQQRIEELAKALDEANTKVTAIDTERNTAQVRAAEAEAKLKSLSLELQQLKKRLDDLNSGTSSSDSDLASAKEEIAKLRQQIESLTKQQQALQADLASAKAAQATAESDSKSATLKLSDALKLLQAAQADNGTNALELTRSRQLATSLQSQLDDSEKKVSALQVQLAQRVSLRSALPLVDLAKMRNTDTSDAEKLESLVGDNNSLRVALIQLLTLTPAQFDRALWPSLVSVAKEPKNLLQLRDLLVEAISQGQPLVTTYLEQGKQLGMTTIDLRNWKALEG